MSKKAKVVADENGVFYFEKIEARIPPTILKKLNKIKAQAHKKIPGLIIWDREKKCKILVRFYDLKVERKINSLGSFQVVELVLEHFLTCKGGKV